MSTQNTMSEESPGSWIEDIKRQWCAAGWLPPEGAPVKPPTPFDVAAYVRDQRMKAWRSLCPAEFRPAIDRTKINNLTAWDEADKWDGGFPGVWLWSHDTGEAKTRMLWRKFGHLHVKKAKNVLRVTGFNLAEEYHDHFNRNKTPDFYRSLMSVDVVMLDDLDKMPLPNDRDGFAQQDQAARNARMLRELFDKFYENHVSVLVTANEPVAWFGERIGPSGARRMTEVCREISF